MFPSKSCSKFLSHVLSKATINEKKLVEVVNTVQLQFDPCLSEGQSHCVCKFATTLTNICDVTLVIVPIFLYFFI